ncbi:MAG: alpha-galactosidase, partial [Atopostipes sp.]|nr:alpha-galactosidase [Atopostipes sp.]
IVEEKYLVHLYWGKKINNENLGYDYPQGKTSFLAHPEELVDEKFSLGIVPQEYPGTDIGDYRESAYTYIDKDKIRANRLEYKSYSITKEKKELEGLPQTYLTDESQAETLEITLKDPFTGMESILSYTIFEDLPVITRSVKFTNTSNSKLELTKALSMSVDFVESDFELIQLSGAWGRERDLIRTPIVRGIHKLDSKKGTTGHNYQPFLALAREETTEQSGEVYAFHFIYSGEFLANVEVDNYYQTRVQMGINPEHFNWQLKSKDSFQTPEVVMVYSDDGLNDMSHTFHDLYQNNLIRGKHQYEERPVLMNNWEGTYFDFNEEKILNMVDEAAELGIELFVLDDGWFGERDDDTRSLGDWFVNKEKLPNGLKKISDAIHEKGMKFGLWFEPEMISEDSDLYRSHPDWALHTPGRPKSRSRDQFVIDFSRKEVRENIIKQMKAILDNVPVDYIKWDYNRNITELNTAAKGVHPGEVAHRYILGLYEVMEELVSSYPNILFESCSGGGARFDPGILYYMPQTWTSDNTDAAARLEIQYGTSLTMPTSSMGAHVSDVPNHQVNRYTSLKTRGDVAMSGNLGYELDVTKLTDEQKETVKKQINMYKKHRKLIQFGRFYRILSPFEGKNHASWIFVDEEQNNAIYHYFQIMDKANKPYKRIKLVGLDPDKIYQLDNGKLLGGDELMNRGIFLDPELVGDYQSRRIYLKAVGN